VASCGDDLERAACALLAAHVGEIRRLVGRRSRTGRERLGWVAHTSQIGDGVGEMVHRDRLDARERDLGAGLRRTDQPVELRPPRALRRHQRPGNGTDTAVERSSPNAATPSSASAGNWCDAARTARAIGRSKPDPSLRRPAGARLTVIRRDRELKLRGGDAAADAFLRSPDRPGRPVRRSRTTAPRAVGAPRPRPGVGPGRPVRG